jgi:hypothetical protein
LAFAYNTCLISIAAGVLIPFLGVGIFEWLPMLAGLAMAMSSVTVVGNSILLRRYKPRFAKKKQDREKKSIPVRISKKLIRYSQLVDDYHLTSSNKTRSLMTLSVNCRPNKLVTRPF